MYGILSVGQAGASIGDLFAKEGVPTIAINFSQRDLDSSQHIDKKLRLVGSEGVGKSRSDAIRLMNQNWETAVSFVTDHFSQPSTQLIFVIFSTGGGTGSGIAPVLVDLLTNQFEDKTIVCCPILPSINESVVAHINTLECLKELSELDVCILPIDNNNVTANSKKELYQQVNETFVATMDTIINQTNLHSTYGNLDQKDLLVLLSTKGYCHISHTNLTDLSGNISLVKESVTQAIHDSWKKSIFTAPSNSKIIRFGVIFNAQEKLMQCIDIKEILSYFDNYPMDVFEGWYTENKGDVFTVHCGLSFNTARLEQIETKTITESETLSDVLKMNHSITYKTPTLEYRPKEKQKKALSSILSKYQK